MTKVKLRFVLGSQRTFKGTGLLNYNVNILDANRSRPDFKI